ncbi:hypothetical protein D3C76_19960 [compost metagenome]
MFHKGSPSKKNILHKYYLNEKKRKVKLFNKKKDTVLIFLSTYCVRCLNILPELNKLESIPGTSIIIFSDGDHYDNQDIKKVFSIKFHLISVSETQLEEEIDVTVHPFFALVNKEGEIYYKNELKSIEDITQQLLVH